MGSALSRPRGPGWGRYRGRRRYRDGHQTRAQNPDFRVACNNPEGVTGRARPQTLSPVSFGEEKKAPRKWETELDR